MFAKKTVSVLLVIVMCVLIFSGCAGNAQIKYSYNAKAKIKSLDSGTLAENGKFKLSWDNYSKGIYLENKKTGKIWSNVLESGDTSTLDIYVQDMQIFQSEFVSSQDLLKKNRISAEKIKNGIKLTYYFDKVKVSVPVCYTLRNDSMLISINGKDVGEDGKKYRLVTAVPSPHMTSVLQTEEDSYIFVSSGIGALIDIGLDADGERKASTGNANVAALSTTSDSNTGESNGIRAFGLKIGKESMFCIPEENGGAIASRFSSGDKKSSYSTVYSEFYFTDSDYTKGKAASSGDVRLLSDRIQSTMSIGYYPLSGENCDYNGMAKCYRKYLEKNGYISKDKKDYSSPYAVTAIGGVMSTTSVAGVPASTLKCATTFSQAEEMVESISKETGVKPIVRLKGYGESGINIGKIAGGYTFPSIFGNNDSRISLENYCKDNKIKLYTNFDLVRFSKSGSGFSYANNAAKTATLHTAEFSPVNVPLRDFNTKLSYRLLSRTKLEKAVDKLVDMCRKKDVSGVCLEYLCSKYYSDYTDIKYAVTSLTETDSKEYINKLKKNKTAVSGSATAGIAAGLMDTVFEAPLDKSGNYAFSKEIPFYQLVFAGTTPLYSAPVNISSNPDEKIMLAAASGTGLGFSVLKNFENDYMETGVEKLYSCTYDYSLELIKSSLNKYSKVYNAVAGSKIDKYEFVDSNVTKTVFENGVTVYANHSSDEADSPIGKLAGFGFKMESGGLS